MTGEERFQLRSLPFSARLALTLLLLVNLAGFVASGLHMESHHENRDERPGLSMDDLQGAYHGVRSAAALPRALNAGHPAEIEDAPELPKVKRDLLLKWLNGDKISDNYDNLDLGDAAPAEILATHCVSCHSRNSKDEAAKKLPLEFWDDVKNVSFSREIAPTDVKILLASTHTHAISLATITLVLALLMAFTRFPAILRGGLPLLAALGLSTDLAAWWLARSIPELVYAIVAAGIVYAGAVGLMTLALILDLWRARS